MNMQYSLAKMHFPKLHQCAKTDAALCNPCVDDDQDVYY